MHHSIFIPLIHGYIDRKAARMAARSGFEPELYTPAIRSTVINELASALCTLADDDARVRNHVMALAEQYVKPHHWPHEHTTMAGDTEIIVGWDVWGEDLPATQWEPAEHAELEWEILTPGIKLSPYDTVRIEDELWTLAEEMKDSAEEDAAESRAFDRQIERELYTCNF